MIVMLTAVFAQTFSSTPDIRVSDPSIGSTFTIALGQSKISGLVHRAEIVDFGLEVSGTTKTGWFAYRHDHTGKIAVAISTSPRSLGFCKPDQALKFSSTTSVICRDVAVASQEQPKYPRLAASAIRSMRSMSWCRSLPRPLPLPGETRPWSPRRFKPPS